MKKIETEKAVKDLVFQWFKFREGFSYAPVQNGLGVHGVPDRLGVIPIIVTPEMVGKRIGLFVSVESKRPSRRGEKDGGMSKHQVLFQEAVRAAGGVSICCDSEEDLRLLDCLFWELQHVPVKK